MDVLSFVANMVSSLVWPTVIIICFFFLRKPLAQLIPLVRSLKYKDLQIEFGKQLKELEEKADRAALPTIEPSAETRAIPGPEAGYWETIERLSEVSPRASIAEAWRRVEWALDDYFWRRGLKRTPSYQGMLRVLHTQGGAFPRAAMSLFEDLRVLRNRAVQARDFEIDSERALEFARLAERLVAAFESEQTDEQCEMSSTQRGGAPDRQ
jgi:hypothetical protein